MLWQSHVTQYPYCIRSHTKQALQKGASKEEIMDSIWIASEMRAVPLRVVYYGTNPSKTKRLIKNLKTLLTEQNKQS